MKKITLFFALLTISFGYAQVLVDFEGGAYPGNVDGTLAYDVQEHTPPTDTAEFTQLANPDMTNNPSATAAKIVTDDAGQGWQNAQLFLAPGDEIDLTDPSSKLISVKIWSDMATSVLAKVVDGAIDPTVTGEIATDASHGGTGWETLTFDFLNAKDGTSTHDDTYSRILFFPLWNGAGWACDFNGAPTACPVMTIWVDDITNETTLGTKDYQVIDFSAYPNPTRDSWTVKTKSEKMSSINVFDVLGKNVLSMTPNTIEAKINASNLKSGIYFAKINTESGSSSIKLVKE